MREIFNFLTDNWQYIVAVFTLVVSVIISLIRKRPVTDVYSAIYQWCLVAIEMAENTDLKGSEKMDYALGFVVQAFKARYGSNTKLPCSLAYIEMQIEQILELPQKKEVK